MIHNSNKVLIDLQSHSTYSDGYLTPTELVELLYSKGVKVASLTDHNTVGGLHEFRHACRKYHIKSIIGMELYIKYAGKKFNLLWYNFDDDNPRLHDMLRDSQIRRRRQARKVLLALEKRGFKLEVNKILDRYTRYIPINRLVDDLMSEKTNMKKISLELNERLPREEHVIEKYFKDPKISVMKPAYIGFERVVELRKELGGQLILCHPAKHDYIDADFWRKLKATGLDGVELLSPHHSYSAIMYIQHLCRELSLIETGGSDFHRFEGHGQTIQHAWQYFKIHDKYLRGVEKIIG